MQNISHIHLNMKIITLLSCNYINNFNRSLSLLFFLLYICVYIHLLLFFQIKIGESFSIFQF